MFSIHSYRCCRCEHSCKTKGEGIHFEEAYCSHPLFIFIDSDAFGAYRFPFHGIERFAFDGVLAVLCDRNIHLTIVFLSAKKTFERTGNFVYLTWHNCLTLIGWTIKKIYQTFSRVDHPRENLKGQHTNLADEAVRMPLRVERGDVILHDGFIAATALGREHIKVVRAAVRLAVPLMEPVFPELLAALGAEEMLRVPSLLQRSYTFLKRESTSAP